MDTLDEFIAKRKLEVDRIAAAVITTQAVNTIPPVNDIPLEGNHWLSLSNVTCVYADLVGSTRLQVVKQASVTAKVYQLFVENLVRTLRNFNAQYVDIRGDGAFGIYIGETSAIVGLCAAVTFKTLCNRLLKNKIPGFMILPHIGIDQKSILLKRIGQRGDWQNEVWAGKPVSMAAKLASMAGADEILTSDRAYGLFASPKFNKWAVLSCGCKNGQPSSNYTNLWTELDISTVAHFDFPKAYRIKSNWCATHGNDYCKKLCSLV